MLSKLQDRLPKEFVLKRIQTIEEANAYLRDVYIPRHNERFSVPAKEEKFPKFKLCKRGRAYSSGDICVISVLHAYEDAGILLGSVGALCELIQDTSSLRLNLARNPGAETPKSL